MKKLANRRITIGNAADILNVRPSYVRKLIARGTLPQPDAADLLLAQAVLDHEERMRAEQKKGLEEMVAISREAGLYDDEPSNGETKTR